jgi:hypothetical protein
MFPLPGTGPFEVQVPADLGSVALEFLQDVSGDGPTKGDPMAVLDLTIGTKDISGLVVAIKAGGRKTMLPPEHVDAAPGAPGGGAHDGPGDGAGEAGHVHTAAAPGAPGGGTPGEGGISAAQFALDPCVETKGARALLKGEIVRTGGDEPVDIDIFLVDAAGPGGRAYLCKTKRRPGTFELKVPATLGPLLFEAFVDAEGDGPSTDDPFATCVCNPVDPTDPPADGLRFVFDR